MDFRSLSALESSGPGYILYQYISYFHWSSISYHFLSSFSTAGVSSLGLKYEILRWRNLEEAHSLILTSLNCWSLLLKYVPDIVGDGGSFYGERVETSTHTHTHTHTHTSNMFLTRIKMFKFTFNGACPGNICIVYVIMNNRKIQLL